MTDVLTRLTAALAGRYRLERELGAGGMATVYLAHDEKHERDVAIKVLHPDLGAVLGGDRFLTEIKTTARLQHPHILPLLDSGAADGLLYYVMPFMRGETLRARLEREQQLPIDEAVRLAREVADALQAAHALGVIHRDIKPENILLQDGHALVADFGIALAVQQAGGQRMTQTGLSLGTPQYMSPEQASGERTVDARSDVYALAAVTYEMLTGAPPFTGGSVQAVIARVLASDPEPMGRVRRTIPAALDAAVLKGLAKLPADRFASARAFADALRDDGATAPAMSAAMSGRERPSRGRRALVVGATALVAASVGWWVGQGGTGSGSSPSTITSRLEFTTVPVIPIAFPFSGIVSSLALSPDGTVIAFAAREKGTTAIAVRRLDQMAARIIPGTEGGRYPTFSPDGRWIAFESTADGQIKKVLVDGTGLTNVCAVRGAGTSGLAWLSNDVLMFATRGMVDGGLLRVPAGGGRPERFTVNDTAAGERYLLSPVAVPGGRFVVYSSTRASSSELFLGVADLESGKGRSLREIRATRALGVIEGTLVYVRPDGALMAAAFDTRTGAVGEPVQVGDSIVTRQWDAAAALSASGALLFQQGGVSSRLVLVDTLGRERALIDSVRPFGHPRYAPDGRTIAVDVRGPGGTVDIWTLELSSGTMSRLTTTGANDRPEWSPDGRQIVSSNSQGVPSLWIQPPDGSAPGARVSGILGIVREGVFTPDGRSIVYRADTDQRERDILSIELGRVPPAAPVPLLATDADEKQPRISPDGRWLAYVSDESGREEVYVRAVAGTGGRVLVSQGGGGEPLWSRDGRTLFYRVGDQLWAVSVGAGPVPDVSKRRLLFAGQYASDIYHQNYDVAPDGSALLMVQPADADRRFVMINNWVRELQARLGPTQ